MRSTNNTVWQNLAALGKTILAHVSISYDGSKGSFHIDIIPTEPQEVIVEGALDRAPDVKALVSQSDDTGNGTSPNNDAAMGEQSGECSEGENTTGVSR